MNRLELLVHYEDANGNGRWNDAYSNNLPDDAEVKAAFDYTLNLDGTRRGVAEYDGRGSKTLIQWTYDGLSRLTGERYDRGATGPGAEDYESTHAYDLVGNRDSLQTDFGDDGSNDQTTTYAYDAKDRLNAETLDSVTAGADRHTVYSYVPTVQMGNLPDAGRKLFSVSRTKKGTANDADRLRNYLARFGLAWSDLVSKQ